MLFHSFCHTPIRSGRLQCTGMYLVSGDNFQPPYFIAACAHKQMLAHNIIGTWSVLDDSSLLQAAFDVPSLCRPCALGAEASRGVVSANPHSKLAGCASKIHIVDVYSQSWPIDFVQANLLQVSISCITKCHRVGDKKMLGCDFFSSGQCRPMNCWE